MYGPGGACDFEMRSRRRVMGVYRRRRDFSWDSYKSHYNNNNNDGNDKNRFKTRTDDDDDGVRIKIFESGTITHTRSRLAPSGR